MSYTFKVSIIITAHNYGKYLRQCIESALNQHYDDYEVIIVNDGSTDYTKNILKVYETNPRVKIFNLGGIGLAAASNYGIKNSGGEYIIRLDADDYFDENILLIESNILDKHPEIGQVYPDYYRVNQYGEIIEHVRLPKVHDEIKLLDRSPLAAGAMYRRSCYLAIDGYNEKLRYQEDYDFWLRFVDKFNVYNVNLPLMYYRQHGKSMSTNAVPRMNARRTVKRTIAKRNLNKPVVLGIIPAKENDWNGKSLALEKLNGKPVLAYSVEETLKCESLSRVIVSTDSAEIANLAKELGAEVPFIRPKSMSLNTIPLEDVYINVLNYLEKDAEGSLPDLVVSMQICSPLRKAVHIQEAIDTMALHDTDSVISVFSDKSFRWKHGPDGLVPVFFKKRLLRHEKETTFQENGAVYVYKTKNLLKNRGLGKSISYIEMLSEESLRLKSLLDFWIVDQMLKQGKVPF